MKGIYKMHECVALHKMKITPLLSTLLSPIRSTSFEHEHKNNAYIDDIDRRRRPGRRRRDAIKSYADANCNTYHHHLTTTVVDAVAPIPTAV